MRAEVSDDIVKGLQLRVTVNGVRSWYHVYRFGNQQRRMFLGHHPDISLVKARSLVRVAKEQLAIGNDPFTLRQEKIASQIRIVENEITVAQLANQCLERHWKINTRTWRETSQLLDNHILPTLGEKPAKSLKRRDIVAHLDNLASSPRPSSANHVLVTLRKMYNFGIERDLIESNPCHGIKKPVKIVERERALNDDEIKKFWNATGQLGYPYGPLYRLMLLTGLRLGECSRIQWDYLSGNVLHLPGTITKAKRGHQVPISSLAEEIFFSTPRFTGPYVFTTKRATPFSEQYIRLLQSHIISAAEGAPDDTEHPAPKNHIRFGARTSKILKNSENSILLNFH